MKQNKMSKKLKRRSTAIRMPTSAEAGRCFIATSGVELIELEEGNAMVDFDKVTARCREAIESEVNTLPQYISPQSIK
jgi:hypothetical protein